MNGKPDEYPDQWVRQSLDNLPDTPPPGTAFDAERLWKQLSPEVQKSPANRRRGWVWWAAAACLAGAMLGWFRVSQPSERNHAINRGKHPATSVTAIRPEQTAPVARNLDESTRQTNARPSFARSTRHSEQPTTAPTPIPSVKESARPVAYARELPVPANRDSATRAVPEPTETTTVVAVPKRRFRVVHLNELQAEENIRPTLPRTDRLVRLGTGSSGQSAPETDHPTITWPLTTKSNH